MFNHEYSLILFVFENSKVLRIVYIKTIDRERETERGRENLYRDRTFSVSPNLIYFVELTCEVPLLYSRREKKFYK